MPQFDFFTFFVQVFLFSLGGILFSLIYMFFLLKNSFNGARIKHIISEFLCYNDKFKLIYSKIRYLAAKIIIRKFFK